MTKPLINRHILIVEDSPSGAAWSRFLARLGGATTTVVDAVTAAKQYLDAAGEHVPDLVLLDFDLADTTSGSQLAAELRANTRYTHMTRVSISTYPRDVVLEGFDDPATLYHAFIEKPIIPSELVSTIVTLLETHSGAGT